MSNELSSLASMLPVERSCSPTSGMDRVTIIMILSLKGLVRQWSPSLMGQSFAEFRESDKSLKHEWGSI